MFPALVSADAIRRWHTVWSPSQASLPTDAWAFRYPILGNRRKLLPEAANMVAGRFVHESVSRLVRGDDIEHAINHAESQMRAYLPRSWDDGKDAKQKEGNLEDIATMVRLAWEAIEPIVKGANYIEQESKMLAELPGVLNPVIGYNDLRFAIPSGGRVIELKTKWRTQDKRTKTGFKAPTLPKQTQAEHRHQASFYAHATGLNVSMVYVRPTDWAVYDETCDLALEPATMRANIEDLRITFMVRQRLLSLASNAYDLAALIEPDFSHWAWDIGPAFREEARMLWRESIEGQVAHG